MADNVEIQGLEFQIQEDSAQAIQGLERLTATLTKLKTATSGGVSGLSTTAKQLERLNTALAGLDKRSTVKLTGLANGLRALGQIGQIKVSSSIANQVNALGAALEHIQLTDKEKLAALAEGLRPLSELEKANLTSFLTQLSKLPEIVQKLDEVDMEKFVRQLKELHEAIVPLADDMTKVSSGFSSFPAQIQKASSALSSANTSSARKGSLFSGINKGLSVVGIGLTLQKLAGFLSDVITKSNQYQEDLNLFTVAMGQYAEEALEYGKTVSEVMGIDLSEWIRNQGVFNTLFTGFGNAADRAALMSKNLTQLGYDISSFFNISVADAMQKLQSGISGELEPLRRLGYDLSQAKLQETALTLGIEKKLSAMTQAEKAELRYYAIMTQVTAAQGDMARTLEAPANQLRILKAQFEMAGRAIGNIFIPMLNRILPVAIAAMQVIRDLANAIASLFGFKLTEVDYSGVGDLASGAEDASDALDSAAGAAKKLQDYTAGFDELNIFDPSSASGAGAGAAGGGSGFDYELPEYDFLGDAMNDRIAKLKKMIEDLLPVIAGVAAGLAAWEIATNLFPQLSKLDALLGSLMVAVGVTLLIDSIKDIIVNGLNWKNVLEGAAGGAITGAGLGFMLAKALGLDWLDGMLTGAVIGLGVAFLIESVTSILAHGLDIWAGLLGAIGGALAGAMIGSKIEKIGAGFGATIGLSVALAIMGISSILKDGLNPVNALMTVLGTAFTAAQLVFKLGKVAGIGSAIATVTVTLGLLMAIGGFTYQLKNGANLAAGLISVLGTALAGAGIGFVVSGGNIVGAGIGAAIGLIVGIAIEFIGIESAAKAAYEASEDFAIMEGVIERCKDASERCATGMSNLKSNLESLDQVSTNFAAASTLVDEIFEINENANASAYELELMQVKVDVLNGMNIAGLSLSIDETTGRVIESRQEVEKLIDALKREAEIEAMNELLVQAYKDRAQAERDLTEATKEQKIAAEKLKETTDELANTPWYDLSRRAELKEAQEKQNEALETANQAYQDAQDLLADLDGAIDEYADKIVGLKSAEEGVGDELVEGLGNVQTSLDEVSGSMEGYGQKIREGLLRGLDKDSSELEYRKRWRKLPETFKDEMEIHSPSHLFEGFGGDVDTGLLNGLSGSWSSIDEFFAEKTNAIKETCSETWENVKTTAGEKWETIKSDLGTAWENIKSDANEKFTRTKEDISTAWTNTKNDTTSKWSLIKSDVGNKWTGIKSDASTKFGAVSSGIAQKWTDTRKNTDSTWTQISGSLGKSWDGVNTTANEKFGTVSKTIGDIWSGLVESAKGWGRDIGGNIASGIEAAKARVESAVNSVADTVRSFLHFSEPDVGPLSDFHTYMPDMMDLMAEGIRANEHIPVDAVYDLANSVAETFQRVSAQSENFQVEETVAVRYVDDQNGFPQPDSRWEDHSKVEVDNEEVIAALFAVGQQIVTAINEKDNNTYIDGKQVMQTVEKHQRQRGANIMAGGVMP